MKKLVSIIIPAYNAANHISECLSSVKKQDYSQIEVIVIDDGSTDDTMKIVTNDFKWVRIVSQVNRGPSAARNWGIKEARGEYLCFVDADDIVSHDMVSRLMFGLEKNQVDFAVCGIYMFNDDRKIFRHIPVSAETQNIFGNKNIFQYIYPFFNTYKVNAPYGRIFRKKIILQNSIKFDEHLSLGEDSVFNLDYYSAINSCCFIREELYGYRRGNNYLTKKYSGDFKENKKRRFEEMKRILQNKNFKQDFLNGQLIFITYSYLLELPLKLKSKTRKQKYQIIRETIGDSDLQEALDNFSGNLIIKILALLLRTKNPRIIYLMAWIINKVRQVIRNKN